MEVNAREDQQYKRSSVLFPMYVKNHGDWLEKFIGNLMVVATVIAAMSFQCMVTPPGGVWQADDDCTTANNGTKTCTVLAGTSVLEHEDSKKRYYSALVICCTVSFLSSMTLILTVISGARLRNPKVVEFLVTLMMIAVFCMSAAFLFTVALVQSKTRKLVERLIITGTVLFIYPAFLLLFQIGSFIWWLVCRCFNRFFNRRQSLPNP